MAATPVLNDAATVVIMAPIALAIAERTGLNADPFLIAVAVGASCDFLTPFGHHNNTIIMGPGGYRFTDFARMGPPLEAVVLVVALIVIPMLWHFCYLVSPSPGGPDLVASPDFSAFLPVTRCHVVFLLLNR